MKYILFLFLFNIQTAYSKEDVVLCFESWPPAQIVSDDSKQQKNGYLVDMMRDIFTKHGFNVILRPTPYLRAIKDVEIGRCDLHPGGTREVSKLTLHPKMPSYPSEYVFFTRKDFNFHYTGPESLKNVKLGNVAGYDYSSVDKKLQEYITAGGRNVTTIYGDTSAKQIIQKIDNKDLDVFCEDKIVALNIINELGISKKMQVSGSLPTPINLYPLFSPVDSKKSLRLIKAFEEEMKKNSSLLKSYINKYVVIEEKK